ncbi:DUF1566 domain-containing protein [Micromonospora sp. 067-2]|uniref:Lcl C-terminal domain-containing protein n=1 Tax=Micromonospora sp. 067-2 TaxID=2789270 RepID=UPI003978811D
MKNRLSTVLIAGTLALVPTACGRAPATPVEAGRSAPEAATAAATPTADARSDLGTAPPPSPSSSGPAAGSTGPATRASGGCGAGGPAAVWAGWPMPNPRGTGLPRPASYTVRGDGTVRDNVTCLVWQRSPAPRTYDWAAATRYCADLTLAGGGWRLPTRVELTSLVDVSAANPAIDTRAFPGTPPRFFWTASPWAVRRSPALSWMINFYEGLATNAGNQASAFHVRCVRSPVGSGRPRLRVTAGEVSDPRTGLTWQRADSGRTMRAGQAAGYCAALSLAGTRWRLPSVKELATTVDESRVAPAIDRAAFPATVADGWYWSSSAGLTAQNRSDPGRPWALDYEDGFTNFRDIGQARVRCVR